MLNLPQAFGTKIISTCSEQRALRYWLHYFPSKQGKSRITKKELDRENDDNMS